MSGGRPILRTQEQESRPFSLRPRRARTRVAQAIVQRISGTHGDPLQVFVSHTKRHSPDEEPDHVTRLVNRIRTFLAETRLVDSFNETSLQAGEDWEERLVTEAARGCLLMVRTDLYA